MKNLILIGAGFPDTKCAASLVVGNSKSDDEFEICEVSKSKVHAKLNEFSEQGIACIYMVGTSLTNNYDEILKIARKLHKNGVKLVWISAIPTKKYAENELSKYITLCFKTGTSLLDVTREFLKTNKGDDLYKHLSQLLSEKKSDKDAIVVELLNAVSSRCRRFQDMIILEKVVKDLAGYRSAVLRDKMLEKYDVVIDEYRHFGKRELKGTSKKNIELKRLIKKIGKNSNCNVLITG